jgi:cytochrome c553
MKGRAQVLWLALGVILSAAMLPAAQAAGQSGAESACASCHGMRGEGNAALGAPRLAGQDGAYLARQLRSFKAGTRGYHPDDQAGARMRAVAAKLSEAEIEAFAAEYGKMNANAVQTGTVGATDDGKGRELYLSTCSQCHGPHAQGYAQLQSPNLNLLGDWYIAAQIDGYVKGWRGNAEGADLPSMWMRSIASHIGSPKDLADVIHYIGSLQTAGLSK